MRRCDRSFEAIFGIFGYQEQCRTEVRGNLRHGLLLHAIDDFPEMGIVDIWNEETNGFLYRLKQEPGRGIHYVVQLGYSS